MTMLVSSIFAEPKKVFKLGSGTKIITGSTSCNPSKWLGVENDSCVCCLLKHTPLGKVTEAKEIKILNSCLKYCNGPVLDSLSKRLEFKKQQTGSPYLGLVPLILKTFSGLQYIDMSSEDLDREGNLSEKSSVILLQKAESLNDSMKELLAGKVFSSQKLGEGGAQTLQLFLIKEADTPKYILKGMKKGEEEVKNLEIIRNSKINQLALDPNKIQRAKPALALDVNNFSYTDKKGAEHTASLIHLAGGKDLAKIIFDWTNHPEDKEKKNLVNLANYRLGNNLGLIHKDFMIPLGKVFGKTYVHGDLHPYNIFYDFKNDRIIFIDCESFSISIANPRDPSVDIMKFFGRLIASSLDKKHAYVTKLVSKDDFYENTVKQFVLGYINAYHPEKQQEVFEKLFQIMTTQGALEIYLDNSKTIINPIELALSRDITKQTFKTIARDFPNLKYPGLGNVKTNITSVERVMSHKLTEPTFKVIDRNTPKLKIPK